MDRIKYKGVLRGLKTAAEGAADLLYPPRCPVCDRPVPVPGSRICPECLGTLRPVRGNTCRKCGRPLQNGDILCHDCACMRHAYDTGCAVYRYRDISGSLYRFKFEGRAEYAAFYGRQIAERIREVMDPSGFDALIPVPVSAHRLRTRGYNQAQLLAKEAGKILGIPVRTDLLIRARQTPGMRTLSASERHKNLKNAFIVHGNDVEFMRIMLIDDIYTTGATIDACALALRGAGAARICYAAAAIGEIHDQ